VPTLPYHVLDVFTDRPYAGNPLAVVLDGDDLSTESMQAIAREFNLSETTFPTSSDRADYAVRIFTPGTELPFAGHPSIGTAWLLARLGRIPAGEVRQDCAAGVLPVAVTGSGATLTGGAPTVSDPLDAEPLLHSVGLEAGSLAGIAPPRTAGTGLEWTYLAVEADAVARAAPDWIGLARSVPSTGVAVFSWAEGVAHLRAMTTEGFEDPATGSAALGFGVYLAASGLVPDGTTEYRIHQGAEIGRPSTLYGTVTTDGGTVSAVTVRGGVVPVATGEITPPA
jgi:trans-2,3-dihydro-3-hydroxyanthranilate isomerase